jgi:hypothetical protein
MPDASTTVLRFPTWVSWLSRLLSALLLAMSFFFTFVFGEASRENLNNGQGILSLLFFVFFFALAVMFIFMPSVTVLTLHAEWFEYRTLGSKKQIRWTDITELEDYVTTQNRMLVYRLKNSQKAKNKFVMGWGNYDGFIGNVAFMNFDAFRKLIFGYWQEAKKTNAQCTASLLDSRLDDSEVQFQLAQLFADVSEHTQALEWYRKASESGHREACLKYGLMLGGETGLQLVRDVCIGDDAIAQEAQRVLPGMMLNLACRLIANKPYWARARFNVSLAFD